VIRDARDDQFRRASRPVLSQKTCPGSHARRNVRRAVRFRPRDRGDRVRLIAQRILWRARSTRVAPRWCFPPSCWRA